MRSAIGALRGKQQIELTNSALGLGCRVETLNTAGEGAPTDTGRGGNSCDEAPRADGGSGAGIVANSLPRPPEDATDGRGLGGAGEELAGALAGALPRPPEAKGGDGGSAGVNDMGQSTASQVRSAIGALNGKQQAEPTNSVLGLGCRVETLNTGGEGAPTDTSSGGNNRGLGGITDSGSDSEDGGGGNVLDVPPEQQLYGQAGVGGGAAFDEDCIVGGRPPDAPNGFGGGSLDGASAANRQVPTDLPPYLLAIQIVIARDRILLRPAVAQVVHLAETEAAKGAGLIELAQQALDQERLGDEDIEQLEQLDECGLALMLGEGGLALAQRLGEDKLAALRNWKAGANPRG